MKMFVCFRKNTCPYFEESRIKTVLTERDGLRAENAQLRQHYAMAEDRIKRLEAQIASLTGELKNVKHDNEKLRHKLLSISEIEEEEEKRPSVRPPGKRRGAPIGHKGATRKTPVPPDRIVEVQLDSCPKCKSTELSLCKGAYDHSQEDLEIRRITTLFRHYKYWCRHCKKVVYGTGEGELPNSYIGPNMKIIIELLRYNSGLPYGKVQGICKNLFGIDITGAGLVYMDNLMSSSGQGAYEKIGRDILISDKLHIDETGWKLDKDNYWLWCFANHHNAFYRIDKSRGSKVINDTIGNFGGFVISDFFSAYNAMDAKNRAKCNSHLLKDVNEVSEVCEDNVATAFLGGLKEILKHGIDCYNQFIDGKLTKNYLREKRNELIQKTNGLCAAALAYDKAETLRNRMMKYMDEIFRYLEYPDIVDPTNNFCERQLRPDVIMRNNTHGSRSRNGLRNHSVMMTLLETAKLRKLNAKEILLALLKRDENRSAELFDAKPPCNTS